MTLAACSERGMIGQRTDQSRASCSPPSVCALSFKRGSAIIPDSRHRSVHSRWEGVRTRKLVRHVLVVLVAELVGADQGAGLGVTCAVVSLQEPPTIACACFLPMYCWRAPSCQSSSGSCEKIEGESRTYLELVPVFLQSGWVSGGARPIGGRDRNTLRPILRRLPSVLERVDMVTAGAVWRLAVEC